MKKIVSILIVLLTCVFVGALYGVLKQPGEAATVSAEQVDMGQFPDQMPPIVLDSMCGYPLY